MEDCYNYREFNNSVSVESYYLFLDDVRIPCDIYRGEALTKNWVLVKNYEQFVACITLNGLPEYVSFDHDLADEHYNNILYTDEGEIIGASSSNEYMEKTGYDCAKWIVDYCFKNGKKMPFFSSHSYNPVGKKNIMEYLNNAKKYML